MARPGEHPSTVLPRVGTRRTGARGGIGRSVAPALPRDVAVSRRPIHSSPRSAVRLIGCRRKGGRESFEEDTPRPGIQASRHSPRRQGSTRRGPNTLVAAFPHEAPALLKQGRIRATRHAHPIQNSGATAQRRWSKVYAYVQRLVGEENRHGSNLVQMMKGRTRQERRMRSSFVRHDLR